MIIPRKINFTQLGRYGKHCEQCFRQNFTKGFDWLSYNLLLCEELFDKRTPWIGYFWSGCAGQVKRGLEIIGIGLIDIDKHDCMMLKAVQSPDTVTLSNRGVTLNDWYLKILERDREQLLSVSKYLVADAYFSKYSFTQGLQAMGFHLISRLRDDSHLQYIYQGKKSGKKGRPKTFDGKIDIKRFDFSRMERLNIKDQDGELYTLIAHSKPLKRNIRLVIWISRKEAHKLYFSTDIRMTGQDVIQYYRTRFQIDFCDSKQFNSQARDINRLDFAFNASLMAVNAAKVMMKENFIPFSMNTLKKLMYKSYILIFFLICLALSQTRR